jgi:hypothetical protein
MRTKRLMLVFLVAFATFASFVAAAAAGPGPHWPIPPRTTHATKPVPASVIVPKTVATLPGGTYSWSQPIWVRVGGVSMPTLSHATHAGTTQPPAWIPIA